MASYDRPKAGTRDRLTQAGGIAAAGAGGALAGSALADRGDREGQLGERREGLQGERGERQEGRLAQRDERQGERGELRGDRREELKQSREARRDDVEERRQSFSDNRDDIRNERQERMDEVRKNRQEFAEDWREDRQDFAEEWREDRHDLWEDIYDDHRYWGDWDDDWFDDDDWWIWGLAAGAVGYAIGASVNDPPYGTVAVPYGGTNFQYYGGAFYEPAPSGEGYVTTTAPIGAVVEAPPIDCTIVFSPNPDDPGYCYFQGAFFVYDEKTDQYVVAEPAPGTEVPYLPEGYKEIDIGGKEVLELGGVYYRHYIAGDEEVFVVVKA